MPSDDDQWTGARERQAALARVAKRLSTNADYLLRTSAEIAALVVIMWWLATHRIWADAAGG